MKELPAHDPTGLSLWQRCPRRYWFERVKKATPDHALTGFAAPLGVAGHAGIAFLLRNPTSSPETVRERMVTAFQEDLCESQSRGRSYDPDSVARALDRLETEYLDLVLRVGRDPRVGMIEWTEVEGRVERLDPKGRRFAARFNALGRVKEAIPAFGRRVWDEVSLGPGTWVVVDWRFGQRLDLSPTALALNMQLALWMRGLEWRGTRPLRAFVGAVRDLVPRRIVKDETGEVIPRTLEELNPLYVSALAEGRVVGPAVLAEAEHSRRRFVADGTVIPKRIRRTNPRWEALAHLPRGPLFHEAEIAWPVVEPTIERAVQEIEAAAAEGREGAYPARGAETQACAACPFRAQCLHEVDRGCLAFEDHVSVPDLDEEQEGDMPW